ncbi:MAG: hypothetical protein H6766_06040 [Candidatus Peribacteria bacterium]|nr:MAG: hypothetical protein H6766_06040 [Candidatus Peribacteria bacterium]
MMIYEPIFIKDLIDILTSSSPNIHEVYRILQWILWLAIITFLGWRLVEYAIVDAQLVPMKVITDESFAYIHRHSTRWFGDKMSGKLLKIIKQ